MLGDRRVPLFRGYDDGYMQLDDRKLGAGFVLHQGEVISPWGPENLADIRPEHLAQIFATPPEVLLIGTGRRTKFPAGPVMQALDDAHIGFECMDSRAAARTYNILVEEGRNVSVAMLLPAAR